jgi:negative regulator of flagellin synthesis FlgM
MSEKISGPGMTAVGDAASARRPTSSESGHERRAATSSADPVNRDTVSLTPTAVLLSQLEELLAAAPPQDADRIAAIKEAVASGTYEVDAERIADKMIRMERDLG